MSKKEAAMEMINPQLRELEQKYSDLQNTVSLMRGELNEVKRTSSDTSRQTIWQFVIFTVTMLAALFGALKFQTDTLRNEIQALRNEMSIRSEATNTKIDQAEKNINARFEDLKQEVRLDRKK
ncbi:MAG: hypothetical protein ACKVZH_07700 [Blastocatellia bacterium]